MEKAIAIRKRKPEFLRQDTYKCSFKNKWRKPRGMHNKMRLNIAGHSASPSIGYGMPAEYKGLHRSGLEIINVTCYKDVEGLDPKKHGLMLDSNLGLRKKVELLKKLGDKFRIFNVKNVEKFLSDVKVQLENKKKESKNRIEKKTKAKVEAEKKVVEKETKKEEEKTPEENNEVKQKKLVKKAEAKKK